MVTIAEASRRTGVSRDTVRNYIKEGKIEAALVDRGYGKPTYIFHEAELEKLPRPHRKRSQEEEVPQVENPTQGDPRPMVYIEGSPAQIAELKTLLQRAS